MSFSGDGGVEKMIANLCLGMLQAGFRVDLILSQAKGRHLHSIPEGVRLFKLGTNHTYSALPGLVSYLRREKPSSLLAAKDRAIKTAVLARFFAHSDVPLFGRIGTTVSAALDGHSRLRKAIWFLSMRIFFRFTDGIIVVSEGVARDVRRITSLPPGRVTVIRNPVITPQLYSLADEPAPHPWLEESETPVIMGVGRLTRQKDFGTLIKAFAQVRKVRDCRLVILGEGAQRGAIETLAKELGVKNDVYLPGFVENPYSFIARSSLFVLSSRWEGSPNALTEALALGRPVVATDCQSGPRELLENRPFGILVPVGNSDAMADAIIRALDTPADRESFQNAVRGFSLEASTDSYLRTLERFELEDRGDCKPPE